MPKIKVTSNFTDSLKTRAIMLFGRPVVLGKTYNGYVTKWGVTNGTYRAALFEREKLVLVSPDNKEFIFVSGDFAVHRNLVYADSASMFRYTSPVTPETTLDELQRKMHMAPLSMLELVIRAAACSAKY